jgi:hypothetical protein
LKQRAGGYGLTVGSRSDARARAGDSSVVELRRES